MLSLTGECDIAVIGGGSGGYVAAIKAAQLGAKVSLIERDEIGGTCVNRGCIPTKVLLTASELLTSKKKFLEYGIDVGKFSVNYEKLLSKKNSVVRTLVKGVEKLLEKNSIQLIRGVGRLVSNNEINITLKDEKNFNLHANKIIIATGSEAPKREFIGFEDILTTDDALALNRPPKSIVIVGGGPTGVEFACLFNTLGADVTLIEMMPQILPTEDGEIAFLLNSQLEKSGIKTMVNANVKQISGGINEKTILVEGKDEEKTFKVEKVLVAFGRILNTQDIGLENVGIKIENKRICVNEKMETSVPGIYAVGDVTGGMYAHTAFVEGEIAAKNAMGEEVSIDRRVVPRCIYCVPEVAAVGLTEEQANEKGFNVKIGRFPYAYNGRALTLNEGDGLVKVIADDKTGEILGVHIIGFNSSELIAEAALAMKLECTIDEITETIHAHPTLTEAFKEAALDVKGQAIHK